MTSFYLSNSLEPKPLKHLKNTNKQYGYKVWRQGIWPEVKRFFGYSKDHQPLFIELFEHEIAVLKEGVTGSEGKENHTTELKDKCMAEFQRLITRMNLLSAVNSIAMSVIRNNSGHGEHLGININKKKAKELAPHVLQLLKFLELDSTTEKEPSEIADLNNSASQSEYFDEMPPSSSPTKA
jgi:hypothetical protein